MQSMEIHYTMQRLICCTIFMPELAMGILREFSRHHVFILKISSCIMVCYRKDI